MEFKCPHPESAYPDNDPIARCIGCPHYDCNGKVYFYRSIFKDNIKRNNMERSIQQVVHDKRVLESKITHLLVNFIHQNPDIKLNGVNIEFTECKDVTSKVISTCVSTDISIKL